MKNIKKIRVNQPIFRLKHNHWLCMVHAGWLNMLIKPMWYTLILFPKVIGTFFGYFDPNKNLFT